MAEVLNYPGDQRRFDPDWMLGPDMDRRRLRIVRAKYDATADRTTCTLRAIMPDEFRQRVAQIQDQIRAAERIRALFTGA